MYEAFYGFSEKPFSLTPDPKFLYPSTKHNEAFAHLTFGLEQRGGFTVVTGEVGTGKTTLCRYFLDRLDTNTISAFILYPTLATNELLRSINRDLGISTWGQTDKALIDTLHEFLLDSCRNGKNVVLVIDEAQNLSRDVLEQVRLISNLETDTAKLIQIVLIGQSELSHMLSQKDLRQLAQRVTARYHLTPLSCEEMTEYVRHRLTVAEGDAGVDFTNAALRVIHRYSKGVPRLINLVCDRALLGGFVRDSKIINRSIALQAVSEVEGSAKNRWLPRLGFGTWATLLLVLGVFIGGVSLAGVGLTHRGFPWSITPASFWSASYNENNGSTLEASKPSNLVDRMTEDFALRLATFSSEFSHRAASAVLLERWGVRLAGGLTAISALEDMASVARRTSLEYLELDSTLAQLRALNIPVVLEMKDPSRDRVLFLALTSLSDGDAVVYFAPGDSYELPVTILTRFWTGRVRLFWKDYDEIELLEASNHMAWTEVRLKSMGVLESDSRPKANELQNIIRTIQEQVYLEPTGIVGDETRMALYSLAGDDRIPQLGER